ncbi:MAG: MBOAT family O-acyltransferase [Pseudomonadota bacterium]
MNFVTLQYAVFLTCVVTLYWQLNRLQQNRMLLAVSWFFYACWDWRFLGLIILICSVDFICGAKIAAADNKSQKRKWLISAIIIDLGILAYFKYMNFFIDSFVDIMAVIGVETSLPMLSIILPAGISFFTFQSLSYSIDIYRGELKPEKSLLDFYAFVAFFPQLVAGPIVRAQEFLFQLSEKRTFNSAVFERGIERILIGLVQKAVVADTLAIQWVEPVFSNPSEFGSASLWLASVAYAVQIYCDFAGYTNIAIGSSLLMGFSLPENFHYPYLAKNFSDFWRRWHMTMSRFFRDYVYIPLGGNRAGPTRSQFNLAATTLVSGLWHGASWNFVGWGAAHGAFLWIQRILPTLPSHLLIRCIKQIIFWILILLTWIIFRSQDWDTTQAYYYGLLFSEGVKQLEFSWFASIALFLGCADHIWVWWKGESYLSRKSLLWQRALFWFGLIMIVLYMKPIEPNAFIYFQF